MNPSKQNFLFSFLLLVGLFACDYKPRYSKKSLVDLNDSDYDKYFVSSFGFTSSHYGLIYADTINYLPILPMRWIVVHCKYPEVIDTTSHEKWIELLEKPETRQHAALCVYSVYKFHALLFEALVSSSRTDLDDLYEREARYLIKEIKAIIQEDQAVNSTL